MRNLLLSFALLVLSCSSLSAEDLPTTLSALPSPKKGSSRVRINSENAADFRSIIIDELYPLVRTGSIEMEAVRELLFVWRLHDGWYDSESAEADHALSEGGSLTDAHLISQGYPFRLNFDGAAAESAEVLGQKALWNLQANFWGQRSLSSAFNMIWLRGDEFVERFEGELERVYPATIGLGKRNQLFRELFAFRKPAAFQHYSWLTFRFVGDHEDLAWIFSPAISKVRQVTGSNRSDPFYRTQFAPEDLFTWSGKPSSVQAMLGSQETKLIPFLSLNFSRTQKAEGGCLTRPSIEARGLSGGLRWNFESRKYIEGRGWLPSSAFYVPRKLWRIELSPRDPYVPYGRQVLYVDVEMQLPVVRVVFDRFGAPWKLVVSVYQLSQTKDRKRKVPFPEFTVVDNFKTSEASIMDFHTFRYCDGQVAKNMVADLDPSHLGPPKAPEVKQVQERSQTEASG